MGELFKPYNWLTFISVAVRSAVQHKLHGRSAGFTSRKSRFASRKIVALVF
jgi:hypothetical protein